MRDRSPSVETRDGDGYYYTYLISRRASVSVLIRGYSLVLFVITLVHMYMYTNGSHTTSTGSAQGVACRAGLQLQSQSTRSIALPYLGVRAGMQMQAADRNRSMYACQPQPAGKRQTTSRNALMTRRTYVYATQQNSATYDSTKFQGKEK